MHDRRATPPRRRAPLWLPRHPPAYYTKLQTDLKRLEGLAERDIDAARRQFDEDLRPRLLMVGGGSRLIRIVEDQLGDGPHINLQRVRESLEDRGESPKMLWMLRAFGVLGLLGGLIGSCVAVGTMQEARSSADWPSVPGRIQSAEPDRQTSSGNTAGSATGRSTRTTSETYWVLEVEYVYSVGGQTYTGTRTSYSDPETYGEVEEARQAARRLLATPDVTVHYDPDAPSVSVLEAGATTKSEAAPYLALLVAAAGIFMLADRMRSLQLRIAVSVVPVLLIALAEALLLGIG